MSKTDPPFDNSPKSKPPADSEIVQRLERSLDFWVSGKEDYPPAIRGVMAHIEDLRADVQAVVQKIGRDSSYPELVLKKLLWFEDKNEKLDEACGESKAAFRPFAVNAEGLVKTQDPNNPLMDKPSRHRLVVTDQFARTNYDQPGASEFLDDDADETNQTEIKANSWKRKITQTLKPWLTKNDNKIEYARMADDLLTTLNVLLSRTKHGWLIVDVFKLKKRRGAILTYARTFEYQRKGKQAFEFKLELFGAAAEYKGRLAKALSNVATMYLDIDELGEIFVTKVSTFQESKDEGKSIAAEGNATEDIELQIDARIVQENGKPSQLVLKPTGKYFESKLAPLVEKGQKLSTKVDLRSAGSGGKRYRFRLNVELDGPLLIASSGDAVIFQLDDMLSRFLGTSLPQVRAEAAKQSGD